MPTTKNLDKALLFPSDWIGAEAEIVAEYNSFDHGKHSAVWNDGYEWGLIKAQNIVRRYPPKRGKWLSVRHESILHDGSVYMFYKCSQCKIVSAQNYDYCPNCGSYNGRNNE